MVTSRASGSETKIKENSDILSKIPYLPFLNSAQYSFPNCLESGFGCLKEYISCLGFCNLKKLKSASMRCRMVETYEIAMAINNDMDQLNGKLIYYI